MITDFFVTKLGMTQAWTQDGKRVAVTRLQAADNVIVGTQPAVADEQILEVGFGKKKLKNVDKPLRTRLEKSNLSGVKHVRGIRVSATEEDSIPKVGESVSIESVLQVGDIVQVQGVTKGRGFAGAMKRHGFKGGPQTHGQSDRARAVGSIGAGTTPGRVWKGKRMPGQYGTDVQTVSGLVVLYIDSEKKEVWLSGPVPGSIKTSLKISKTGRTKTVELNRKASGLPEPVSEPEVTESNEEALAE